jgi:hypothetical protein
MLKFGQFYLATSWIFLYKNCGMDYLRLESLWKHMMMPQHGELDDVTQVFYEHTNLLSKLREIGKTQLIQKLKERRK